MSFPQSIVSKQASLPKSVNRIILDDLTESHLKNVLQSISDQHGKIVNFIHLNPTQPRSKKEILFPEAQKAILRHVFLLAKHLKPTLNQVQAGERNSFVTVTRLDGRFGLEGNDHNVIEGGLFGLTKTMDLEWQPTFCRAIDLSPEIGDEQAAATILAELHDPEQRIVEVGYNAEGRATLVAEQLESGVSVAPSGKIDSSSVFLVSGGAKGVTAQCIFKLAESYKCKFILLGRSGFNAEEPEWAHHCFDEVELKKRIMNALKAQGEKPTPAKIKEHLSPVLSSRVISETLKTIQSVGGTAEYLSCDVTDAATMKNKISSIVKRLGPITGIIHGAGVLADKLIEKKTISDFDAVYSTKVQGLEAMLQCVDAKQLKHIAMFSSAAGFFGNTGQADYALANDILNKAAFLFKRQHPGCHAVTFNWGPWDGGMVTPELKKMFALRNVYVIPLDAGAQTFSDKMGSADETDTQLLVGSSMLVEGENVSPELRKYSISRRLVLEDNPFLKDHVIGGNPVLPTVCASSWMIEACERIYPGYRYFSCEGYQMFKGIIFDNTLADEYIVDITETAKSDQGELDFDVQIWNRGKGGKRVNNYAAKFKLVPTLPDAPIYNAFDKSETSVIAGSTLYQNGTLFHGPLFKAVERVINISQKKLTMECRALELSEAEQGQFPVGTFNPYTADVQFQGMLVWARHFCDAGSLPAKAKKAEHYSSVPNGEHFYVSLDVVSNTATSLIADITAHDESGRVYSRVFGAEVTISKQLNQLFSTAS